MNMTIKSTWDIVTGLLFSAVGFSQTTKNDTAKKKTNIGVTITKTKSCRAKSR